VGTGGMTTKLQAAEKAISSGINTFIVDGFDPMTFNLLLLGENPGTLFHANNKPMSEKSHWMRHTTRAQGELVVDNAYEIDETDELLHSQDIIDVKGDFDAGDVVLIRKHNGEKLAKVQSNYSSCLLNYVASQSPEETTTEPDNLLSDTYVDLIEST
jgi:glutamate 5-kinase